MKKHILLFTLFAFVQINFGQIINSDFENGTLNWSGDLNLPLAEETIQIHGGLKSLNCTFDSPTQANCDLRSDLISGLSPSTSYTISAWFYDNDVAGRANLVFDWYNSLDVYISSSYYGTYTSDQASWQQLTYTITSPANTAGCKVGARFYDISATWDGDCTIFVDDFSGSPSPLPVELNSFNAISKSNNVTLNWSTATEVNNNGFEIQRQSSNKAWENVAFVAGNGNSNSTKNYNYTDNNLTAGKYSYRLKQIDNDGKFEYSKVVEVEVNAPLQYGLAQNYPNPFNPSTVINFTLPEAQFVTLKIYNVLGQEVKTVVNGMKEAGVHTVSFDAKNLNSGLYFYKLEAGSFSSVKKMMLTK